jgi:hypothetical protein
MRKQAREKLAALENAIAELKLLSIAVYPPVTKKYLRFQSTYLSRVATPAGRFSLYSPIS